MAESSGRRRAGARGAKHSIPLTADDELVFLPLGGCGEIGMNLSAYGFGTGAAQRWLLVDLGITFPGSDSPGIDIIMPDPAFLEMERERIVGLILTHGHEDHIGAVPHLWPRFECPIYATPFTAALVRNKLAEIGIGKRAPLNVVPLGGIVELEPFSVEFISLTHSIPEPSALAIRTAAGTILHTGDWKLDPDPLVGRNVEVERLKTIGREGVLAMVCDSTNVFVPGEAGSERSVRERLTELIGTLGGRVAVTGFASNVARMQTVAHAAAANGRHLALVGRAMHRIKAAAEETGYLEGFPPLLGEQEASYLPPEKVLYLCTGSQAEPRSALMKIARGEHPHLRLGAGDSVIFSARVIPGNEREIYELHNSLIAKGVTVYADETEGIHVSGHPCRDELKAMYGWIRPRISVPVHGEMRHLEEHSRYARELGAEHAPILRNGDMLKISPGTPGVIDEIPHGRLLLDGDVLTPDEGPSLKERRRIAVDGLIVVTVAVSDSGNLMAVPMVLVVGVPADLPKPAKTFQETLEDDVESALLQLGRPKREDDEAVDQACRRAVRSRLKGLTGKRPAIEIQIFRLED